MSRVVGGLAVEGSTIYTIDEIVSARSVSVGDVIERLGDRYESEIRHPTHYITGEDPA